MPLAFQKLCAVVEALLTVRQLWFEGVDTVPLKCSASGREAPTAHNSWSGRVCAVLCCAPSAIIIIIAHAAVQAWALLREFNQADAKGIAATYTADAAARGRLRGALRVARECSNTEVGWDADSPSLMLGVLASDVRLGMRALRDWTQAMGMPALTPEIRVRAS